MCENHVSDVNLVDVNEDIRDTQRCVDPPDTVLTHIEQMLH